MKIALTGAAGIQGMSAMIYLLDQDDVTEIFATDLMHLDRVEKRVASLKDSRVKTGRLDCGDEEAAAAAFAGYDVVLNSAMVKGRYINTTRAALAAGASYLDMTSLGEEPLQLELDAAFREKDLVCLLDMGTAPGFSNLMAVYCMNRLDRTESIDYANAVVDTVPASGHSRPLYWGYGFEGIMHLMSGPSILFEDGEIKYLEPRARPEVFPFRSGEQVIMGMPHREPIMLAESFPDAGLKHIMYRQAFDEDSERKYAFLRDLGFAGHEPVDVKGVQVAPYDVLAALLDRLPAETGQPSRYVSELNCIARGWKGGKRYDIRLMLRNEPDSEVHRHYTGRGAFGSYRTGICAAIAAVMIGRGQVARKGVFRPEIGVPAEEFVRELARVGMELEETTTQVL